MCAVSGRGERELARSTRNFIGCRAEFGTIARTCQCHRVIPAARSRALRNVLWTPGWICALLWWGITSAALADAVTDFNVAVVYYNQSRWQLAANSAQDFLNKHPGHEQAPVMRLYLGQSLAHLRQFPKAHEQFQLFLTNSPQHADRPLAMYRLGECSYFDNQHASAEAEFNQFLQAYPDHSLTEWALVYLGESAYRQGKFERALAAFDQGLQKFPAGQMADDARYGRANALESLNRNAEALQEFEAIAARPGSTRAAQAAYAIGSQKFAAKEFEKATEAFDRVVQLAPSHRLAPQAQLHAGYALYYLQRYADAITRFEKITSDPQQGAAARFWKGLSEKSLGRLPAAVNTFAGSLEVDAQQSLADQVLFQWADTETQLKNYPKALELFLKVVERIPQGEFADDALHSAGEVALVMGNPQQAEVFHQRLIKEYPQSGMRLVNELQYGRVLLALGDREGLSATEKELEWTRAVQVLQSVADNTTIDATRTRSYFQLARAFERLKNDAAVLQQLDRVFAKETLLSPEELLGSLLLRAHAAQRQNQPEKAQADYERALTLQVGPREKMEALGGLVALRARSQDWPAVTTRLQEMSQVDATAPQYRRALLAAAEGALQAKNWDLARGWYESLLQAGEAALYYRLALSGRAQADYEMGQFSAAAAGFAKLEEIAGDDRTLAAQSAYDRALSLQQAGQKPEALAAFQQGSQKYSARGQDVPDVQRLPGGKFAYQSAKGGARVARELQQPEVAEQLYEFAYQELKAQPAAEQQELDALLNEWANLSYTAKNYQRSDELFALLVKERPESPLADDAKLVLAESQLFAEKKDQARDAFEKLLADSRSDAAVVQRCLVHLVDLAAESADWNQVKVYSERLQKDFPGSAEQAYLTYRRAESLLQQQRPEEIETAAGLLDKLREELKAKLSSAPDWWPEAWVLLAECRLRLKQHDKVDELVAELRTLKPDAAQQYKLDMIQGRSFVSRALFKEAREAFTKVVDSPHGGRTVTAAEAQFRIAETWLTENNHQTALTEYYKVFAGYDAPKWSAMALFQAGDCERILGNKEPARDAYRQLLEKFPTSDVADQAKQRLEELEKSQ